MGKKIAIIDKSVFLRQYDIGLDLVKLTPKAKFNSFWGYFYIKTIIFPEFQSKKHESISCQRKPGLVDYLLYSVI